MRRVVIADKEYSDFIGFYSPDKNTYYINKAAKPGAKLIRLLVTK